MNESEHYSEKETLKDLESNIFGILEEFQAVVHGKEDNSAKDDAVLEQTVKEVLALFNDPMKSKYLVKRRGWSKF